MELIIGSHVGFKKEKQLLGSVEEALSYNANAFMFYTGAPQNTARTPISPDLTIQALEKMKDAGINPDHVIVHAPYIINLSGVGEKLDFAIRFLKEEINRVETLGFKKLVLHPGSHVGLGYEEGINQIIFALNEVLKKPTNVVVCLETMAGKGSECGITIDQIKTMIDGISKKQNIGVCLDTCHLNDGGYDMSEFDSYLDEFDKKIGLNYIKCIHINDSKNELGAHKDRHENFGYGTIGFDNLIHIVYHDKLKDVPKILETPYVSKADNDKEKIYPPYKFEIRMIRNKVFNPNLLDDIRASY